MARSIGSGSGSGRHQRLQQRLHQQHQEWRRWSFRPHSVKRLLLLPKQRAALFSLYTTHSHPVNALSYCAT
jgi:hypothetical protein